MKKVLLVLLLAVISACSVEDGVDGADGINGVNGEDGFSSLIKILEDNSVCPTGGTKIQSGLDINRNSLLDDSEVESTTYVCNGMNGTNGNDGQNADSSFIFTSEDDFCGDIPGVLFKYGFDINNNGQLDIEEIDGTSIVCNGDTGEQGGTGETGDTGDTGATGDSGYNALVSIDIIDVGEDCFYGGFSISYGLDVNSNGVLDENEINQVETLCNEGVIFPNAGDVLFHGHWVVYQYYDLDPDTSEEGTVIVTELGTVPNITIEYGPIQDTNSGNITIENIGLKSWQSSHASGESGNGPGNETRMNVLDYDSGFDLDALYIPGDSSNPDKISWASLSGGMVFNGILMTNVKLVRMPQP